MILTVDIGNTNIALGGFDDNELRFVARIATDTSATDDEYAVRLISVLSLYKIDRACIGGAIISSVVPQLNAVMKKAIKTVFALDALVVGPGIKTGIGIHCDNPASVGSDLICACVAAHFIYSSPALIVDMGTATKIIATDKKGTFIGVSIMPGLLMGLNALSSQTAQLPQISLTAPASALGKNTADCMRSGAVFGHAAMIDGMIDRIASELAEKPQIFATGGMSEAVIAHLSHSITHDEHLVLKGLNIIYGKNR